MQMVTNADIAQKDFALSVKQHIVIQYHKQMVQMAFCHLFYSFYIRLLIFPYKCLLFYFGK